MKTTKAIFSGYHNDQAASATFELVNKCWDIVLMVGGQTKTVRSGTKYVKPCMTHAAYLMAEYFPPEPKRRARKITPHAATVVQSSFVETKTGTRFKVVK